MTEISGESDKVEQRLRQFWKQGKNGLVVNALVRHFFLLKDLGQFHV